MVTVRQELRLIVLMNVTFERVSVCLDVLCMCKNGVGCSGHQIMSMLCSDCRVESDCNS
jgi:hypothetical protein